MKKTISMMLLLAMAGSTKAGLVLKTEGHIDFCPGLFTTSGQTVVCSISDDNEVTIYTQDFLVDRTFTCVGQEQSGSFTEEATITPTGLKAVPEIIYESGYSYKNYSSYSMFEARSQEEMIEKLKENNSYTTFIAFTDPMGNPACYDNYASFKYENIFGKQYPTSWYALIEGTVYSVSTYDSFYTIEYDEENAVWTRTSDNVETYPTSLKELSPCIDRYNHDEEYASVTQTFFNEDDKWEYIVSEHGQPEIEYYYAATKVNDDGTVTLTRSGIVRTPVTSKAVYNEDGTKLGNIPDFDLALILNGRKFLFSNRVLYEIKGNGSDFDLVETVQAKSEHRLDAKRGIVTVDINAEQAGGEVVVSTTDGKVMASKKVGVGQTQINEQPLPTGIYVVSLLKDGRVVESEKYLVQ